MSGSNGNNTDRTAQLRARYQQLLHAMQTGVAYDLAHDPHSGTPKNLRVGVNSAMCETSALALLLVEKGVFTLEEFYEKLVAQVESEVASYEKKLSERVSAKITLA